MSRKPGDHTPTDTARAQESTAPPMLLYLSWLVELPVTCDGCFCSAPVVLLLQSAVLRARSQELCATEAAEAPLLRLLVPQTEGKKKILFDLLPVHPILVKQSGKCSFQVPPHKSTWRRWEWC